MSRITFYETECSECSGDVTDRGYIVVDRKTHDLCMVCGNCYDDAPDDKWGITYLEW